MIKKILYIKLTGSGITANANDRVAVQLLKRHGIFCKMLITRSHYGDLSEIEQRVHGERFPYSQWSGDKRKISRTVLQSFYSLWSCMIGYANAYVRILYLEIVQDRKQNKSESIFGGCYGHLS